MIVYGTLQAVKDEVRAQGTDKEFTCTVAYVLTGPTTIEKATLARSFDVTDLPAEGQQVALDCAVGAYVTRSNSAIVTRTALRVLDAQFAAKTGLKSA